jgi:holin-like protein
MLEAILALFACQLMGEAIARGLGLPVPGPVLGMLLMFMALQIWYWRKARDTRAESASVPGIEKTSLEVVSAFLLANLSLLFVPAGVGIISHIKILSAHGIGLVVALVLSTALSLAVTAIAFAKLSKIFETPADTHRGDRP